MRTCTDCKITQPLNEFAPRKRGSDKLRTQCRTCRREYDRKKYRENPNHYKLKAKKERSYRLYKLSPEELESLKKLQKYRCGLCGVEGRRLVADHDHRTGKFRGMVCDPCNTVIIPVADSNPDIFRRAKQYVRNGGLGMEKLLWCCRSVNERPQGQEE